MSQAVAERIGRPSMVNQSNTFMRYAGRSVVDTHCEIVYLPVPRWTCDALAQHVEWRGDMC